MDAYRKIKGVPDKVFYLKLLSNSYIHPEHLLNDPGISSKIQQLNPISIGRCMSENKLIDWKYISSHSTVKWDYSLLSRSPNITIATVKANPNLPWDHDELSINPSININTVLDNPDIAWNNDYLSMNQSINLSTMKRHPDIKWNFQMLSLNPTVDITMIRKYPEINWDIVFLCRNPGLELDDCITLLEKHNHVDKTYLSSHPRLNENHIDQIAIEWNYNLLSINDSIGWETVLNKTNSNWTADVFKKGSWMLKLLYKKLDEEKIKLGKEMINYINEPLWCPRKGYYPYHHYMKILEVYDRQNAMSDEEVSNDLSKPAYQIDE